MGDSAVGRPTQSRSSRGQLVAEILRRQDALAPRLRGDRTRAPAFRECSGRRRDRSGRAASGNLPASSCVQQRLRGRPCPLQHSCSFSPCHATRANAARAVVTNDSISAGDLAPGASSTPLDTSTPKGRTCAMASATFAGDSPPARISSHARASSARRAPSRPSCPCRCAALRTAALTGMRRPALAARTAQHRPARQRPAGSCDASQVFGIGLQHIGPELARRSAAAARRRDAA